MDEQVSAARYVTQRGGWIVLDFDGRLVAEEVGRPGERWPVAPIVEVTSSGFVVTCPGCKPRRGRPAKHEHGSPGRALGEGHRLGHGDGCSDRGYVALLLDADAVKFGHGVRLVEP